MPTFVKKYAKKKRFPKPKRRFVKKVYKKYRRLPPVISTRHKIVRLRYAQEYVLNVGAGYNAIQVFRANSIYDPDYTGTGHQPMGYDVWAQLYGRYYVLGSRITVQPVPDTSSAVVPSYYGIMLSRAYDTISSTTAMSTILENRDTNQRVKVAGSLYQNNPMVTRQSMNYSAKRFFNVKDVIDNPDLGGAFGANADTPAYFIHFCNSINGNDMGPTTFIAQISYIVLLEEPLKLSQN